MKVLNIVIEIVFYLHVLANYIHQWESKIHHIKYIPFFNSREDFSIIIINFQ